MRRCKYCGKSNEKHSTYCIICGNKLNSSPDLSKEDQKALYDKIIRNYIRRYNLTDKQIKTLKSRLNNTNLNNKNFYTKLSEIIKEVIIDSIRGFDSSDDVNFEFHTDELLQLKNDFDFKIKKLKEIILEDFTESKITQDYFISHVDYCSKVFNSQIKAINKINELNTDNSKTLEREIIKKIEILKVLIDKINTLTNEVIIAVSSKMNKDEFDDLSHEMDNLINSVKDYQMN